MNCPECGGPLESQGEFKHSCSNCGVAFVQQEFWGEGMVNSNEKGKSAEREFAKLVGGKRVPLSGAMRSGEDFANDVLLPNGWQAEVKRFKAGEKTLYGWLFDPVERPDIVGFRADKMPWVVAMNAGKFNRMMNVHIAAQILTSLVDEDGFVIPGMYKEFAEAVEKLDEALAGARRENENEWHKAKEQLKNTD